MIKKLKLFMLNVAAGANIAVIVLMLLSGYSDHVAPSSFPHLSWLGLAFPAFLLLNLLFVFFWILVRWLWIPIVGYALAYVPITIYLPLNAQQDLPDGTIKVLSFNVACYSGNGVYHEHEGFDSVYSYLARQQADIVCLQEDNDTWRRFVMHRYGKIYPYNDTTVFCKDQAFNGVGIHTRFPILRNGRGEYGPENLNVDDYHESGKFRDIGSSFAMYPDENVGNKILVDAVGDAQHENLLNGCIYPIERILVYTDNVQKRLGGERIRIDMAAMFPEMMNNDLRRPLSYYSYGVNQTRGFPQNYNYLEDVRMEEGTEFYYFTGHDRGWSNYQMDEYNIIGKYEFTMKLPPVPIKGHYEVRFGVSSGSQVRSMCQVYFGNDLNYLPAAGIPMDLRIGFVNHRFRNGTQASNF